MAAPELRMSALSLLEVPPASSSPSPPSSPGVAVTNGSDLPPSSSPPVAPVRKRRTAKRLSKRMQSAFRAYLASIAAGIPVLLSTQFPVEILALHHLILAFPEWPNTPLPAPDPPLPPYTPTRHSAASKLDPASYRWKPKPPAPVVATVYPTNALLQSVHAQFRPVLQSLHDVLHALGHFLHLSLPALDDTSNSALNTPQSVLSAVRRQQRFLNPWLTARVHYLAQRASMVETCIKYGWEWNYVAALSEWDEREYVRWRNGMRELRGRMVALYHLVNKNSERLLQHSSFQLQLT